MRPTAQLSIVRDPPPAASSEASAGDLCDLILIATLFALNLVPVAGELAGVGHWSPAIVGFAAGAAILTGRELVSQLRALRKARG